MWAPWWEKRMEAGEGGALSECLSLRVRTRSCPGSWRSLRLKTQSALSTTWGPRANLSPLHHCLHLHPSLFAPLSPHPLTLITLFDFVAVMWHIQLVYPQAEKYNTSLSGCANTYFQYFSLLLFLVLNKSGPFYEHIFWNNILIYISETVPPETG